MSQTNLTRNINPALITEILSDTGYVAFWYRDGGTCRVVTNAPYAAIASAVFVAGGR